MVEGAGGFYSPLAEDGLNADLAKSLNLKIIIVVNDRISAVNQALMTIKAVEQYDLSIAAIILNQVQDTSLAEMDNRSDLKSYCSHPIFRCAYHGLLENIFE